MTSVPVGSGLIDAQGVLISDLECKRCGYNLRGLHQEGRCPECGTPVGLSTLGDLLRFADPNWLDKVALGLTILLWMILGGIVVVVAAAVLQNQGSLLQVALAFGVALITFYGTWLVTEPDPSGIGEDPNLTARKVLRASLVIGLVFDAAEVAAAAATGSMTSTLLQWLAAGDQVVGLVTMFTTFMYYERLARRIPDLALAARARLLRWGNVIALGVIAVGGAAAAFLTTAGGTSSGAGFGAAVCLLAPASLAVLVFAVMAIFLLIRLRRAIAEQARLARVTWAAALEGTPTAPIGPGTGR
ncbi:MAG: hypothetical protein KA383_05155 [Phycisphaerae bacterium]|nr:hypothetical protein [Phycisphaerae bacterium]